MNVENKNKNSLLNASMSVLLTMVNGLLGIVTTRYVITVFGSDFNGLNSTANQIVNVLLILEGGFTVASNVALFYPLGQGNQQLVNGILVATRKKFRKIGLLFLGIGTLLATVYPIIVNSQLPPELTFTVIWMTVFPAAFNLFFATTYRVLLQAQQKEYVISGFTALTIGFGHITNIFLIIQGCQMWMVRTITMLYSLINSLLIMVYVRRKNAFINFKVESKGDLIKGTNDVLIQKITGVIYNAAPIVFLSIAPTGGTVLASVYAVYNNVITMIKSLLHSVIDAPRLGFGQLLSERNRNDVWPAFSQYELLAFMAVCILLSTTYVLILPFVTLYTGGITDANYKDPIIALMLILIAAIEMLHIPSGHLLNMAGEFRVSRNIQMAACIALVVCMPTGGFAFGIYGMLYALFLVALLLAFLEIGYVHIRFFEGKVIMLFKLLAPTMMISIMAAFVESTVLPIVINSIWSFIIYGALWGSVNTILVLTVNILFQRKRIMSLAQRVVRIYQNSQNKSKN